MTGHLGGTLAKLANCSSPWCAIKPFSLPINTPPYFRFLVWKNREKQLYYGKISPCIFSPKSEHPTKLETWNFCSNLLFYNRHLPISQENPQILMTKQNPQILGLWPNFSRNQGRPKFGSSMVHETRFWCLEAKGEVENSMVQNSPITGSLEHKDRTHIVMQP